MSQRQADVFPVTLTSWIDDRLAGGNTGRQEVNRHVMAVYQWPLTVYFMGTRDRYLGEPADVVQGFFASRLSKGDFFAQWRSSGMKLRQWLINAFCFYLKEVKRSKRRDARQVQQDEQDQGPAAPQANEFDRAYVVSLVREALKKTQEICERENLLTHWEVFVRHYYQGQAYTDFAEELGVDPARCAVMSRTARTKFQNTLRQMLTRDVPAGVNIDDEILALLEDAS